MYVYIYIVSLLFYCLSVLVGDLLVSTRRTLLRDPKLQRPILRLELEEPGSAQHAEDQGAEDRRQRSGAHEQADPH